MFDTAEEITSYLLTAHGRKYFNNDYVFRGEPRRFLDVLPALDRVVRHFDTGLDIRVSIELEHIRRFFHDAFMHLPEVERRLLEEGAVLPVMRHHGAPTRLLDWTESPWIALFFACCSAFDENGRVLCFKRHELTQRVHRDFADQTAKLSGVAYIGQTLLPIKIPQLFNPEELHLLDRWVVCYHHVGPSFPKLVAQQGLFTLASLPNTDHWQTVQTLTPEHALELTIPADQKRECLAHLRLMGITAASLFPGISGVAFDSSLHLEERLFPGR